MRQPVVAALPNATWFGVIADVDIVGPQPSPAAPAGSEQRDSDEQLVQSQMVCGQGSTVCTATYSGNGRGCCPYDDAVCCPNGQTCCPSGTSCNDTGKYLTQCIPQGGSSSLGAVPVTMTPGLSVCKPGAALPPSKSLPNVLIIGDSVSIGYTPPVAADMAKVALVQHSPWDTRDGGAEETAYGVQCLKYFLRSPLGVPLRPDVIMFNWVSGYRAPLSSCD